jgi:hypothetical protein
MKTLIRARPSRVRGCSTQESSCWLFSFACTCGCDEEDRAERVWRFRAGSVAQTFEDQESVGTTGVLDEGGSMSI